MSLKDLFKESAGLQNVEPLTQANISSQIESFDFMKVVATRNQKFLPLENFAVPAAFARFGSAEKYYEDSIKRIYNTYPYDGSLKEKILWEISSSYLDLYLFENGYPRTTGYANFIVPPGTTGPEGPGSDLNFYPSSGDDEYILIKGGPHPGHGVSLYYDAAQNKTVYREDANVYDLSENRENNLKIGGTDGNTIEFWLKKEAYIANQEYFEFVLDAHVTGTTEGDTDYGRFFVALATSGTINNTSFQPFLIGYASASTDIKTYIGSGITTGSVADGNWHHYAIRTKTTGSDTVFDLFVDGQHNDRYLEVGDTVGYVSGAIVATLGAQAAPLDVGGTDYGDRGWAKLSGSIDEFRYWKTFRTSQKLQRYWFDQVGGGTNTDTANTQLGVYYKFNEGITGQAGTDSTVLDYSGRISNGLWTGYSTTYSRNTGSAILESGASAIEFKDPILYATHTDVSAFLDKKKLVGRQHDDTNANKMDSYLPSWMLSANETDYDNLDKNDLLNALQIMASYFDSAAILINKLPSLKHEKYYTSGTMPPPFNKEFLHSKGLLAPDIFINATLLEQFEDRDNNLKFEETLQEIKNTIYQNIYNNLTYIYKAKGTEKAFRNMLRCLGLGSDALKFNIYANNGTYKLEDNTSHVTKTKNYVNFNEIDNGDATVYQYQIDSNATSYISGTQVYDDSSEGSGLAFTMETDIILPNRVAINEYSTLRQGTNSAFSNLYPLIISSSLFGLHTANGTQNDLTWATNDYANFQVYTVKDDKFSSTAKFVLTGTVGGGIPLLTSSYFEDVYDDDKWTVSVTIRPNSYPYANQVSGAAENGYIVQFYGANHIADLKRDSFFVTGRMTTQEGRNFLASHKRAYVGAHHTNFTGSRLEFSDVKATEVKAWCTDIATASIDHHNMQSDNFGTQSPMKSAFLYQGIVKNRDITEIDTLALRWNFANVTSSNAVGEFSVEDISSGSATDDRFGWFSGVVNRRHTASGSFFPASSKKVVQGLSRGTLQQQVPEVLLDSNLVRIIEEQSDDFYTRDSRPTTYNLSIEKNLFQDISEEMLNMFASVGYFNTLLGNNVNRYRGQYKELIKASDKFFEKVDNDYDFDKYVEYFKYIDQAMSQYIHKLIPASMDLLKDGISTVIENFVLGDRNKFRSKAPIIKEKIPEFNAQALGINELDYNWKFGHAPLDDLEKNNCLWWRERALRTNSVITNVSVTTPAVNYDKQEMLDAINNETNAPEYTLVDNTTSAQYSGSTFAIRRLAKPYKVLSNREKTLHGGGNYSPNKKYEIIKPEILFAHPASDLEDTNGRLVLPLAELESLKNCDDGLDQGLKRKRYGLAYISHDDIDDDTHIAEKQGYLIGKSDLFTPFSMYSSSQAATYHEVTAWQNIDFTNTHDDVYGPNYEIPLQGPFTEKFVGGNQYRHIALNSGSSLDNITTRPEGWRFTLAPTVLYIWAGGAEAVDWPNATRYRSPMAKRPLNIANIQQTTASNITNIGNYTNDYDIVLTNGRSINNVYLTEVGGITASSLPTPFSGVFDYTLPQRGDSKWIFVNRFSAPGGPEINGLGALDIEAAEYSVYNALPWRNLTVRGPLNELLSDHSKQFGYFSDAFNSASYVLAGQTYPGTSGSVNALNYAGSASFQKVNRNSIKTLALTDTTTNFSNAIYVDFEISSRQYLSSSASSGFLTNNFSISAWIKLETSGTAAHTIMQYGDQHSSQETERFWWYLEGEASGLGSVLSLVLSDGTNGGESITYAVQPTSMAHMVPEGSWLHLAVTVENGNSATDRTVKMYKNGTLLPTGQGAGDWPAGTTMPTSKASIRVGGYLFNDRPVAAQTFDGTIDEVSYWDAPLIPVSIKEIYEGSSGVYTAAPGPGNLNHHTKKANLVSWWRMGDGCKASDPTFCDDVTPGVTDGVLDVGLNDNQNHLGVPDTSDGPGTNNPVSSSDNFLTGTAYYLIQQSVEYDNFFVQHLIPRTDLQYAWITASLSSSYTGPALYQYEQKNFARADYASTDITFCSASDWGSYGGGGLNTRIWGGTYASQGSNEFVPTDFVGINSNIYEPITSSTNTVGYPPGMRLVGATTSQIGYTNKRATAIGHVGFITSNATAQIILGAQAFNSLILHRQGPYGGANWKLWRKDMHPIVRYQRENNTIGYLKTKTVNLTRDEAKAMGGNPGLQGTTTETITNFREPCITTKYKPLRFYSPSADNANGYVKSLMSYGNVDTLFTDHSDDITNPVALDEVLTKHDLANQALFHKTFSPYLAMRTLVLKSDTKDVTEVSYKEIIYPKERYTYLSGSRKRPLYLNDFWRTLPNDRLRANLENSMGSTIDLSSIWKMDAHAEFRENTYYVPYSGGMPEEDGAGELQNCYNLFHYGTASNLIAAPSYIRRIPLIASFAYPNNFVPGLTAEFNARKVTIDNAFFAIGAVNKTTPPANCARYSASVGDTYWEGGRIDHSRGQPFYDSYDEYAEDGFRMMKGGTILPEFRISEKMESYIENNWAGPWPKGQIDAPTFTNFRHINATSAEEQDLPDSASIAKALRMANGLLELTGTSGSAADTPSEIDKFLTRYAFSDFYKHFKLVHTDYNDNRDVKLGGQGFDVIAENIRTPRFSIACEAVLKLLPYKGFYPSERTAQLSSLFRSHVMYDTELGGTQGHARTIIQPFFAPGLLYNTIKSGIAVDYPIHNAASQNLGFASSSVWGTSLSGNFNQRLNFEQLITPPPWFNIMDNEPLLDTRIDSTASFKYQGRPAYSLAMSNFIAESTNFFLKNGEVTAIIAEPLPLEGTIDIPVAGNYVMDIVLRNSTNIITFENFVEATASLNASAQTYSSLSLNSASITMYNRGITGYSIDPHIYGSSFGPPVDVGNPPGARGSDYVASFDPYTPPYYDGYGYCRLSVDLAKQDGLLIGTLLNSLTRSYGRMTTFANNIVNSTAAPNAMQVSASLNFGQIASPYQTTHGTWIFINEDDPSDQRLMIHPKFECPVLDFSDANPRRGPMSPTYNQPQPVSGNAARGMWHQYGTLPTSSNGIWLTTEDPTGDLKSLNQGGRTSFDPDAQSLAPLLGFAGDGSGRTIGSLADSQTLSEAIVAIPFKLNNANGETQLYEMDSNAVQKAIDLGGLADGRMLQHQNKGILDAWRPLPSTPPEGVDGSIYKLLRLMRKYVIPPHFDFLHFNSHKGYEGVSPFAMYMWEFEVKLDLEDLQNIWQNIEPKIAKKAQKMRSDVITHVLPTRMEEALKGQTAEWHGTIGHEYFSEIFDPDKTRWAVFKVKKRGRNNFANVVGRQEARGKNYVREDVLHPHDLIYSYNWPHDFFSLIELANITTDITFNPQGPPLYSEAILTALKTGKTLSDLVTLWKPPGEEE